MDYNVEMHVGVREVERLGKDGAIARATQDAWFLAVKENRPQRSVALRSIEVIECAPGSIYSYLAYRCRFSFAPARPAPAIPPSRPAAPAARAPRP
jgi:hypothetical protein